MLQGHRWSGSIEYDADEPGFGEYTNRYTEWFKKVSAY